MGTASTSFQSHFGLILSNPNNQATIADVILSIPFWSDFIERTNGGVGQMVKVFQSHFGLILSCSETIIERSNSLSIPFWSDFINFQVQK